MINYLLARRSRRKAMAELDRIQDEMATTDALAIAAVLEAAGLDVEDASLVDHVTVLAREWKREELRAMGLEAELLRREVRHRQERDRTRRQHESAEQERDHFQGLLGEADTALQDVARALEVEFPADLTYAEIIDRVKLAHSYAKDPAR